MMTNEDRDRLARIEQGLVHIHEKMDMIITPLAKQQAEHHEDIITLKRDRGWLYGILVAFGSLGLVALKFIKWGNA